MEEIGTTNPTSHCEFHGVVCAPMLEKPSPWHPFNHYSRNSWSENPFLSFCVAPIQTTSFHQSYYYAGIRACRFFLSLFYFHRTPFSWACVTPRNYYLKYSFSTYTYLPYNSLISNQICISTSPMYALPYKQLSA